MNRLPTRLDAATSARKAASPARSGTSPEKDDTEVTPEPPAASRAERVRQPADPDPLDHADVARAADAAASENLLRAYVRDTGTAVPPSGVELRLPLPSAGITVHVPVRYHSPTGWHRFGEPALQHGTRADSRAPAGAALLAAATIQETLVSRGLPVARSTDPVARVLDSARRVAAHLADRRAERGPGQGLLPSERPEFLSVEQDLLLGHPFHPAPKSREEASEAELRAYSPELRGSFPLHWFAADPSVLVGESLGGSTPAELLGPLAAFAGLDQDTLLAAGAAPSMVPLPVHPWQAADLARRPETAKLLDSGVLRDLGRRGRHWFPTSSLRTVYHPEAEHMVKLSLGMRVTNSRRNNLRGELRLGVRAARLLAAGPTEWLAARHPEFAIMRDPAWVSAGTGQYETGLELSLRDNPFRSGARTPGGLCVAGLVAERTGPGDGSPPPYRSTLNWAVERVARAHATSLSEAARRWLDRYLDVLVVPMLALHARYGIALEPHHQNTLVALDEDGLPQAGWYRDSQGYYLAASHEKAWEARLPGVTGGVELVFDDAFVDERVGYYLGINNLFGLIGAFGALGIAREEDLLARLRGRLAGLRRTGAGAPGVLDLLLDAPTLRCKGNYLTCVDGRDELIGDVHTQSVYVDLPNPLVEAQR